VYCLKLIKTDLTEVKRNKSMKKSQSSNSASSMIEESSGKLNVFII